MLTMRNMKFTLRNTFGLLSIAAILGACTGQTTGDLTGVEGRRPWYHPQPYGTIYVPTGTFHMGQSEQDIANSLTARPKQVSIQSFYMDDTEITNNEYRQFVYWVRDSIVAKKLGDEYMVEHENAEPTIDWEKVRELNMDDPEVKEQIKPLMYSKEDNISGSDNMDWRKIKYKYKRFDLEEAAKYNNKIKYFKDPKDTSISRRKFIHEYEQEIYPDTLTFVRDFAYAYNEPMTQTYFWHPGYDDYPVVGVSWTQANAFCWWRTLYLNAAYTEIGDPEVNPFRLPIEAEWEYAARGGRRFSAYPWGGPYTRNSRGCFLANFKPMRGDYIGDGGFFPVKATAYFPNDYGLYNMAGNVAEWTSSAYEESAYSFVDDKNPDFHRNVEDDPGNPKYSATTKRKVTRGGSWKDIAFYIQNGTRAYDYQDTAKSYIGFRCVMSYMGRSNRDR